MAEMRFVNRSVVMSLAIGLIVGALLTVGYLKYFRPAAGESATSGTPNSQAATTVILVRHAEKVIDPSNPNVPLSPEGEARAKELARMLGDSGVTAVYASQFVRTQSTVKPLADRLSLPITQVESGQIKEVARDIKSGHVGGVVLLAGHNNTVPAIIAELGGGSYPTIPENEYDNMFIVTIPPVGKTGVLRIKYGSSLTAQGQQMMVQP